jgi:CDP-diacylglycerol--glycerol-3-phosphate 3-phosphatidyltransferase
MPSLYDIKPRFQALLRPIAARLAQRGVSANAVTLAAAGLSVLLGLVTAITGWSWLLLLYPPFLLLRMALNAIDGMLAREFFKPTPLGALLNEVGDMVSDAALYLPLALLLPVPPWLVVVTVMLAVIGEAAGVAARSIGASRRYDGPFGKSDRALAFSILAITAQIQVLAPALWMPLVMAALLLLSVLTILNRIRAALAEIGA